MKEHENKIRYFVNQSTHACYHNHDSLFVARPFSAPTKAFCFNPITEVACLQMKGVNSSIFDRKDVKWLQTWEGDLIAD
jgi:hypothetical protein